MAILIYFFVFQITNACEHIGSMCTIKPDYFEDLIPSEYLVNVKFRVEMKYDLNPIALFAYVNYLNNNRRLANQWWTIAENSIKIANCK